MTQAKKIITDLQKLEEITYDEAKTKNINFNEIKYLSALIEVNNNPNLAYELLLEIFYDDINYIEKAYFDINFKSLKNKIKSFILEYNININDKINMLKDKYKKLSDSKLKANNFLTNYFNKEISIIEKNIKLLENKQEILIRNKSAQIINNIIEPTINFLEFYIDEIKDYYETLSNEINEYLKTNNDLKESEKIIIESPRVEFLNYFKKNEFDTSFNLTRHFEKYNSILENKISNFDVKYDFKSQCLNLKNKCLQLQEISKCIEKYYINDIKALYKTICSFEKKTIKAYNSYKVTEHEQESIDDNIDDIKETMLEIQLTIINRLNTIISEEIPKHYLNEEVSLGIAIASILLYFTWQKNYISGFWLGCGLIFLNLVVLFLIYVIYLANKDQNAIKQHNAYVDLKETAENIDIT